MSKYLQIIVIGLLFVLASCGQVSTPVTDNSGDQGQVTTDNPRSVSYTFSYYFQDTVTSSSPARWTRENISGKKAWVMSSSALQGLAWVLGQNYWNRENDVMTSVPFIIPADRMGNRLSFYARWNIAAGDYGYVEGYNLGSAEAWTNFFTFTGGSNPDYPKYTKYSIALPDTTSELTAQLRIRFTSDTSVTGWGLGVDSISVYQRKLSPPENVIASDGLHANKVDVDWTIPTDILTAEAWNIYRAENIDGPYTLIHTDTNPLQTHYNDSDVVQGTTYYYYVTTSRLGYPDSVASNNDSGFAAP